jgi:Trypsin
MADKGVSCHESCHAGGMCTGALISSRTFVSAAHCHQYAPMTSGGTFFVPGVGNVGIERTFSQGGQLGDDDIAFGRLTTPVWSVTPATIATVEPSQTFLTAMGFGCTNSRSQNCGTSGSKTFVEYFYTGSASNINAPGDSGGPTFVGRLFAFCQGIPYSEMNDGADGIEPVTSCLWGQGQKL